MRASFAVHYNPAVDTSDDITKRIFYYLIVRRLKAKKPVVIFLSGESGEGKSYTALKIQEAILSMTGLKHIDYMDVMNVYTPLEYAKKLDDLLKNPAYKKINIMTVHEARELVKARLWYSFVNQAISDVNAMSRAIKRICFIIISQFIRDIDASVRYTLTYYFKVERPYHKSVRLTIYELYKDDRDIEKPLLRKRKIKGYLIYPNGRRRLIVPKYFEISKPDAEVCRVFDAQDFEAKGKIIRRKLNLLLKEMNQELGSGTEKIKTIAEWYVKHLESLNLIGQIRNTKKGVHWKLKKETQKIHDLTPEETLELEILLNKRLKERGVIPNDEQQQQPAAE